MSASGCIGAKLIRALGGAALMAGMALAQTNSVGSDLCKSVPDSDAVISVLRQLRSVSYPELASVALSVHTFQSDSDYFRTRFSISRFLLLRQMRYFVEVNPRLFSQQPPADGVCAIVAHELAHVDTLSRGNRIRRFGLLRLVSAGYTRRFERRADLEAIHRGYADGLKSYRTWVYAHIPPKDVEEKRRRYFTPEEISTLEQRLQGDPKLFEYWMQRPPMDLQQIQESPR